jgi:hypothetical protein
LNHAALAQAGAAEVRLGKVAAGEVEAGEVAEFEVRSLSAWAARQIGFVRRQDSRQLVHADRVQIGGV